MGVVLSHRPPSIAQPVCRVVGWRGAWSVCGVCGRLVQGLGGARPVCARPVGEVGERERR